jgi:histidinol dehydrogenase
MSLRIRTLNTADAGFRAAFTALLDRAQELDARVEGVVREVIHNVRTRGDNALVDYTAKFDRWTPASSAALEIPRTRFAEAAKNISVEHYKALEAAAARVRSYHERQRIDSWSYTEADGTLLGQQVTALDRAGLYVPGG